MEKPGSLQEPGLKTYRPTYFVLTISNQKICRSDFGKHRKIYSQNKAHIFVRFIWILLHVYGKFMEKICLKAPQHYSVSFWTSNFSISLWERPKPPHFMLSGLSDVSLNPETTCFLSLETPGHIK